MRIIQVCSEIDLKALWKSRKCFLGCVGCISKLLLKYCTLIRKIVFPGPNVKGNTQCKSSAHYLTQEPLSTAFLYYYCSWCITSVLGLGTSILISNALRKFFFQSYQCAYSRVHLIARWCSGNRTWRTWKCILLS